MPFKSDKQRRYLYANKPEVAEKFSKHSMASGGLLTKAIRNMVKTPDLARLRSGGMVKTGSRTPGACMDSQTRSLQKFRDS